LCLWVGGRVTLSRAPLTTQRVGGEEVTGCASAEGASTASCEGRAIRSRSLLVVR
jgi:hypothetical protein